MSKYITIIKNNKKIKYTVLVLIVAIAIIIGINYFQTTNNPDAIRKSTKISADSLKSQAIKILETNPTKAKDLFLQALKTKLLMIKTISSMLMRNFT